MPTYRYESHTVTGTSVRDILEAESPADLFAKLRQRGEFCVAYRETRLKAEEWKEPATAKLAPRELAVVCRQFSTMLNAGLTVIKCLDTLSSQAQKKNTRAALLGVYERVQKGLALSEALLRQQAFPPLLINMVESGEASGSLEPIMERMAEHFEKEYKLRARVINALIYPVTLAVTGVVVMVVLLGFVIPTFFGLFESMGAELPGITLLLLKASEVLKTRWYLLLLLAAGIMGMGFLVWRSPAGRLTLSELALRAPFFGKLQKTLITARFSRSLATLFASGMSLLTALELAQRVVGNVSLDGYMARAIEQVRRGTSLSGVMRGIPVFQPMFSSMVTVGEESGALEDILYKTAAFYDNEADAAISALVAAIEPVMIVAMGIVVGFIVLSVMLPMMSMYQAVAMGAA